MYPKPFFLALSNLEDEIPFKGGSLSHPEIFQILECEIKMNPMFDCLSWLKFHKELKLLSFEIYFSNENRAKVCYFEYAFQWQSYRIFQNLYESNLKVKPKLENKIRRPKWAAPANRASTSRLKEILLPRTLRFRNTTYLAAMTLPSLTIPSVLDLQTPRLKHKSYFPFNYGSIQGIKTSL